MIENYQQAYTFSTLFCFNGTFIHMLDSRATDAWLKYAFNI